MTTPNQNLTQRRQGAKEEKKSLPPVFFASLRFSVRLFCVLGVLSLPACQTRMGDQPSYRPLEPSEFFPDGRSARPVVPGTVARGQLRTDTALYEGKDDKGEFVTEFPFEMTEQVLERGKERFTVFCSVCHGLTGYGDGRIVQRGFTKPPSFHTDVSRGFKLRTPSREIPLRTIAVGYIYDVITNGYGAMPDYNAQIPVKDRWAIAGYVRVLQYSQAPPEERSKLEASWMPKKDKGDKK